MTFYLIINEEEKPSIDDKKISHFSNWNSPLRSIQSLLEKIMLSHSDVLLTHSLLKRISGYTGSEKKQILWPGDLTSDIQIKGTFEAEATYYS